MLNREVITCRLALAPPPLSPGAAPLPPRPPLTREQIEQNAQTYFRQASLVLDPERTEIRYNSAWCDKIGLRDMVQLASRYTVARILERDDFTKRLKAGVPISVHEMLYPLLQGYDMMDGGDGSIAEDPHGTALAGQISAREVEGSGLIGVAPESQILPVRVLAKTNDKAEAEKTRGPEPTHTATGIQWAADNGAKVIVVALSSSVDNPSLKNATEYATSRGALVVASAGNLDPQNPAQQHNVPQYPAAYSDALAVTGVDTTGAPSDAVIHGPHIDVAAPGMNVLTTFVGAGDCVFSGDKPSTSYATGYVGGVAALVAAAHPDETPADWKYRILATALRPTRSMRDNTIGWGLIAPYDALTFTNDGAMPGPPNPRFSTSATQEAPTMTPPSPQKDQRPMRTMVLGIIAGIGCLGTLAALAASRLRSQDAPRRKPRR